MHSGSKNRCIVMGGGPAGLAAAIALRGKGLAVSLYDPATPPIDKACGEGLLPNSVAALDALGVEIPRGIGRPFRGIRFIGYGMSAEAGFRSGHGLAIRRTALHELLADAATRAGVQLHWGYKGAPPMGDGQWMIAADGQNSALRRASGLDRARAERSRFSYRRHFRVAPWTDFVEVYWNRDCQVYVTPLGEKETAAAVISHDRGLRVREALALFPELRAKFSGAEPLSPERGALSVSRSLHHVQRGRTALVGDASGSVDAITGEGLGLAFRQALLLAEAIAAHDLSIYEAGHRSLLRTPRLMEGLLLAMDRVPMLQRTALRTFQTWPMPFASLLALHAQAFA